MRIALGQVYWQRGILDKARTQFEEALKEDDSWEAGCSLGRLLLDLGFADLWRGGETIAPILLVLGYLVLVPIAILK